MSLLLRYTFEGSGTSVPDVSGNGYDATASEAGVQTGGVALISTAAARVVRVSDATLRPTAAASLAVWVNVSPTGAGGEGYPLHHARIYDSTSFGMWMHRSGSDVEVQAVVRSTNNVHVFTAPTFSQDAWHHLALVYDGANAYLYVDGVVKVSAATTGSLVWGTEPERWSWQIGNHQHMPAGMTGYQVDDARVYSNALTTAEVLAIVNGSEGSVPSGGSTTGVGVSTVGAGTKLPAALTYSTTDPITSPVVTLPTSANISRRSMIPLAITTVTPNFFVNDAHSQGNTVPPAWDVEFDFTGSDLAFKFRASPAAGSFLEFFVDGVSITAGPKAPTGITLVSGTVYYARLQLQGNGPHRIRARGRYAGFYDIRTPSGTTLAATPLTKPKIAVVGASFTLNLEGQFHQLQAWLWPFGDDTRVNADVLQAAIGGTGYSTGTIYNTTARVDRLVTWDPDYIIVEGSGNDDAVAYATLNAAAASYFSTLATRLPGVPVLVVGAMPRGDVSSIGSGRATNLKAVRDAALAAPNVVGFIDPIGTAPEGTAAAVYTTGASYSSGAKASYLGAVYQANKAIASAPSTLNAADWDLLSWFTGTGNAGALAGDGNRDIYLGADDAHPTAAGQTYIAGKIADAYVAETSVRSGGSTTGVVVGVAGAGTHARSGGSVVGVSAATAGSGLVRHAGGSSSGVSTTTSGNGSARRSAGSAAGISVAVVGAGQQTAVGRGGSIVSVSTTATTGTGVKLGRGAGTTAPSIAAAGSGWARRVGQGLASVLVRAASPLGQGRDVDVVFLGPVGHPFEVSPPRGHPFAIRRILMELHPEGQELARFTLEGLPDNPGQVSLRLNGGAWIDVTPDADAVVGVLVRGPLAPVDAQAVALPVGVSRAEGRLVDNPERPIRVAGEIRVGL